ncbi:MAG: glycosyltransferase family 2 protein [Bacteroidia bacterium]|nr:glycosyltransferase family 2 protein [Bacteroidia bacterium]
MKIPIVVVNWNGSADTVNCLNSIFNQSYSEYEVFLVDNGSEYDDVQILKDNYADDPRVNLILNSKNLGYTDAHNIILSQLLDSKDSYQYIFLLNNDTEIKENCLEELVRNVNETKADIVACKMLNYFDHSKIDSAGLMMINTGEILPTGSGDDADKFKERENVIGASGGAAFYSVEMLRSVGLFDSYFNTGYEDAELGLRATLAGCKVLFEPNAIVLHKVSTSIDQIRDFNYTVKIQTDVFYTCLKLLPFTVLCLNLPFVLIKYAGIL